MKSLLDPSFRYTASHSTDVRKTFARVRREQAAAAKAEAAKPQEAAFQMYALPSKGRAA